MPVARVRPALGAVLASVAVAVGATHITDRLAVGLYTALDDPQPRRVLASDMPVERLDRQGPWCRVRLADGDEGWLECQYLSDDKPARVLLLEAQVQIAQLRQDLQEREARIRTLTEATTAQPLPAGLPPLDAPSGSPTSTTPTPASDLPPWLPLGLGALMGFLGGIWVMGWRWRRAMRGP